MATSSAQLEQARDITERLRQIALDYVIPAAFPTASVSPEPQGKGTVQWILPDGAKVNVTARNDGDWFHILNRDRDDGRRGGKGAIDFLITMGHSPDFRAAREWLAGLDPGAVAQAETVHRARVQAASKPKALYHPPRRGDRPSLNACLHYLSGQRGISPQIVRGAHDKGLVYADRSGFMVFPHRNPETQAITGYTRRWPGPGEPPVVTGKTGDTYRLPAKGVVSGTDSKAGWFTAGTGRTLVLVESPIDALAFLDLAWRSGHFNEFTARSSGGEAGWDKRMWAGFEQIVVATDNDEAGNKYWSRVVSQLTPEQHAERQLPPEGCKDWGEVVQRLAARPKPAPETEWEME